eukprot:SAG11_NODE_8219_length_1045_cov_1.270613_1_plen_77_part_10
MRIHLPGLRLRGMMRLSTIDTGPLLSTRPALKLPLQSPLVSPAGSLDSSHGGGKQGSCVLSHEVQSSQPSAGGSGQG